jgi:PAS domain S-box-containing protein
MPKLTPDNHAHRYLLPEENPAFSAILNTLQESVFLLDHTFELAWYNKSCEALFYQVTGKHLYENFDFNGLLSLNQQVLFRRYLNKTWTGVPTEFEWHYKRSDSKWFCVSLYPFRTGTAITGICGTLRDITEKKINEQALLRNTAVLNNIDEAVVLTDADFNILAYNSKAHQIVSHFGADLQPGLKVLHYLPAERRATAAKNHSSALQGISTEYEALYPNGQWFLFNFKPVNNGKGRIKQVSVTFRDITERKKISAEMKILSMVAKETLNAVLILRPSGEMLWANEGWSRLTGYTFEELATSRAILHGPNTNMALIEEMKMAREKGIPFNGEQVMYTKSGKKVHTRVEGQPLRDDDGNITSLFVIITDITSEKKIMEEMEVLSLIARETSNGVMIFDKLSSATLWVNDGFTRLTGFAPGDVLGKNPVELLQGADTNQATLDYMTARIEKNLPYSGDLLIYTKNGDKKFHHVTGQPFKDVNGRVTRYFAISTDITERQRMEEERLQKEIELQREIMRVTFETQEKARNELGRELHDNINQILAAINLQISFCLTEYKNGKPVLKKVQENLHEAIDEVRRLSHRMVTPRFSENLLYEKLSKLLDTYSKSQVTRIETTGWTETNIPACIKETFFRIAQEQLNNIHKHAQANEIVVHIKNSLHDATMCIEDNGIGFDTHKQRTGIGISNIISRVELYKGTTSIISSPGNGCVLSISIPLPTG